MLNLVVDSGCDYADEMKSEKDVDISKVPLSIQLGDKQFVDDENLNISTLIDEIRNYPGTPKTAAPSPERYLDKIKNAGNTFVVTLSSHLSGSYSSALAAKQMYMEEIGNKFIHVFDSLSASTGEALVAMKIIECAKKNLSNIEIVEVVDKFIKNMKTYFILENYDTLIKNGRMNSYVAKVASILNIKVICAGENGMIKQAGNARGFEKAVSKLIDRMAQENDLENRTLGIMHVKCLDKALIVKEEVMKRVKFKDIFIAKASGLCTVYASEGGVVLAY